MSEPCIWLEIDFITHYCEGIRNYALGQAKYETCNVEAPAEGIPKALSINGSWCPCRKLKACKCMKKKTTIDTDYYSGTSLMKGQEILFFYSLLFSPFFSLYTYRTGNSIVNSFCFCFCFFQSCTWAT